MRVVELTWTQSQQELLLGDATSSSRASEHRDDRTNDPLRNLQQKTVHFSLLPLALFVGLGLTIEGLDWIPHRRRSEVLVVIGQRDLVGGNELLLVLLELLRVHLDLGRLQRGRLHEVAVGVAARKQAARTVSEMVSKGAQRDWQQPSRQNGAADIQLRMRVPGEAANNVQERLLKVVVGLGRNVVVLQVLLAVEVDVLRLDLSDQCGQSVVSEQRRRQQRRVSELMGPGKHAKPRTRHKQRDARRTLRSLQSTLLPTSTIGMFSQTRVRSLCQWGTLRTENDHDQRESAKARTRTKPTDLL